jgi:hypothetical protein
VGKSIEVSDLFGWIWVYLRFNLGIFCIWEFVSLNWNFFFEEHGLLNDRDFSLLTRVGISKIKMRHFFASNLHLCPKTCECVTVYREVLLISNSIFKERLILEQNIIWRRASLYFRNR